MTNAVVLVTGVAGANVGEQICKALRLARTRRVIIGANMEPALVPAALVDEVVRLPAAHDPEYVPTLVALGRDRHVTDVVPGSEVELLRLVRARDDLSDAGLRLVANDRAVVELCADKVALAGWLADRGLAVPQSFEVRHLDDLRKVGVFPVVAKPRSGGGGSSNVWLAQTADELHAVATFLLADLGSFVVQEYVGRHDEEYTVGVLSDSRGRLVDSIALRRDLTSALSRRHVMKNRSGRADLGPRLVISSGVSQGEVVSHGPVTRACEKLAAVLGSTGPLNVQLRMVEGRPYVFEINPRLSGTTSVRAMVGFNEPDWLLSEPSDGTAGPPARLNYRTGRVVRGLAEYII